MKALSIKQPWAWLITNGPKDVENRYWNVPSSFILPQRIYIHASIAPDTSLWICNCGERVLSSRTMRDSTIHYGYDHLLNERIPDWDKRRDAADYCRWLLTDYMGGVTKKQWRESRALMRECGAIVGEGTVTAWVTSHDSLWFEGPFGLVIEDAVAYDEPIPYKGRLGIWTPTLGLEV